METNLIELMEKLNSEDRCREYIEALRWPSGVCCTRCGSLSVSESSSATSTIATIAAISSPDGRHGFP